MTNDKSANEKKEAAGVFDRELTLTRFSLHGMLAIPPEAFHDVLIILVAWPLRAESRHE